MNMKVVVMFVHRMNSDNLTHSSYVDISLDRMLMLFCIATFLTSSSTVTPSASIIHATSARDATAAMLMFDIIAVYY